MQCRSCKKKCKNILQHLNKSIACTANYDMDLLRKERQTAARQKHALKERARRAANIARDAKAVKNKEKQKTKKRRDASGKGKPKSSLTANVNQPGKEMLCQTCKKKCKNILQHLNKSIACTANYDMDLLRKERQTARRQKHASKERARRAANIARDAKAVKNKEKKRRDASKAKKKQNPGMDMSEKTHSRKWTEGQLAVAPVLEETGSQGESQGAAMEAPGAATVAPDDKEWDGLEDKALLEA